MSLAVVGVSAVAVGAGASIYGASQAGKAGSAPRSVGGELGSLPYKQQIKQANAYSKAQLKNDEAYAKLLLKLSPAFAEQNLEFKTKAAQRALSLYPQFASAERAETDKTRAEDLGDLQQYGAGYVGAFADANPVFRGIMEEAGRGETATPLLGKLNLEALGAGRSDLGALLESQAIDGLLQGRGLSADEERDAGQSARAAFTSRGLAFSPGAIGAEVLSRDAYGRDREAYRRQFGMGVMGLIGNEDEANRRFELNVEGANTGQQGNWRNFLLGAEQATSRPLYAELGTRAPSNVMGGVLGAMGLGYNTGETNASLSGAPSIYQGVQALTPLYNYGADVFNTNFNAGESRQIAQANAWGAVGSGLTSTAGSLGKQYLANQGTRIA